MDLIEPDMDSHNGVIFLGLPTEVVHKVGVVGSPHGGRPEGFTVWLSFGGRPERLPTQPG